MIPSQDVTADELRARLTPVIDQQAKANGVDPAVLRALLEQESGFNPDVVFGRIKSVAGAIGLAQFMPATAKDFSLDPTDPEDSVRAAAQFLGQNLKRYDGDYTLALAAYNWGPGRVDSLLQRAQFESNQYNGPNGGPLDERLRNSIPSETQQYIKAIAGLSEGFGAERRTFTRGALAPGEFIGTVIANFPGSIGGAASRAGASIPGVSGLRDIGDLISLLTDRQNIFRVALTGAAVLMIGAGVFIYVFARPGGKQAITTAAGAAAGGPAGAAAGAAAGA